MITKDFKATEKEVQEALDNMTIHEINLTFNESKDCFNRMVEESKQANRIAVLSFIAISLITIWGCFSQIFIFNKIANDIGGKVSGGLLTFFILALAGKNLRILFMMLHYRGYSLVGNTFRYGIEKPGLKNSIVARILDYQETTNDGYENNQMIYKYSAKYFWEAAYILCASVIVRILIIGIESYIKN